LAPFLIYIYILPPMKT